MLMYPMKSMSPQELVIFGVLVTFLLCDDLDAGNLDVLGNLVVAIGGLILTWAAQKHFLEEAKSANKSMSLQEISNQIQILQDQCRQLENKTKIIGD